MYSCRSLGLLCAIVLQVTILSAQDNFYYTDSGKVQLKADSSSFILYADAPSILELSKKVKKEGGSSDKFSIHKAFPTKQFAIIEVLDGEEINRRQALSQGLGISDESISSYQHGWMLEDGFRIWPTSRVVFKMQENFGVQNLKFILDQYEHEISLGIGDVWRVELRDGTKSMQLANRIFESGLVSFAQPDFYAPMQHQNDPLFTQQFQMNNTGQVIDGVSGVADADCNALEAWGITTGSSSVTVAVIDDGVEDHEDLNDANGVSRLVGGFTPATNGNGTPFNDGAHGQACAGIIAASHNNIGVRGVAPEVRLLSVNIFQGSETTQDIADGITWAKNNGADVMSNSWGYTSCSLSFSNINSALSDATNNGRGGLGCVIVFASGNGYKNCVDYPANNSNVVAVGAFTNQGVRSDYSNYGAALDIMAPSNAVGSQPGAGVRTIDRMGSQGYSGGNYTSSFGGTSAACPVVSGVAALLLSYDAGLSQSDLKSTLNQTAIDMGPNGVDLEYGNGRVDAYGALLSLGNGGGPTCNDGVQNGDETGIDCGGSICPPCQASCSDIEVTLSLTFDNYPEETSWLLKDSGGQTIASGGTYNNQSDGSTLVEELCLSEGCYDFTINDTYGDGICCNYGNGSYSLVQGSAVLVSGGQFGALETTNFCLSSGGADAEPPSVPLNLQASNIGISSFDISWNASSDNIGVDGYRYYLNGSLLGTTVQPSASLNGLSPNTIYSVAVEAFDAAGNVSGQASINVTTLPSSSGCNENEVLLEITFDNYPEETSWVLEDDQGNTVANGGTYGNQADGSTITESFCLSDGCYTFNINDTYGDGICCNYGNGSYALVDGDGSTIVSGGQFGSSESTAFCLGDPPSSGGTTLILGNYFESGWEGWQDGGNDCSRINNGNYAYEGNFSIRLRDNSGVASSMTSPSVNASSFSALEFQFYFYPFSMESGEDFWVQFNDGSGWQTIATYTSGLNFNNGTFYTSTLTLDNMNYNFSSSVQFRIQCDASANGDQVYIDQITLKGIDNSSNVALSGHRLNALERGSGLIQLSEEESSELDLVVFPNPVKDFLFLKVWDEITRIELYDLNGRILVSENGLSEDGRIDVHNLPGGIYILRVKTKEEMLETRIIKQ